MTKKKKSGNNIQNKLQQTSSISTNQNHNLVFNGIVFIEQNEYDRLCTENMGLKQKILDLERNEKNFIETINHNNRTIDI
jgi:hypothetical protein